MTLVDFDPEFAGSAASQQGQAVILAHLEEIAASPGMLSRGTRVAVLDAWCRTPEALLGIAPRFGSAAIVLHHDDTDHCRPVSCRGWPRFHNVRGAWNRLRSLPTARIAVSGILPVDRRIAEGRGASDGPCRPTTQGAGAAT